MKILKCLLKGLLIVFLLFCLLMIIPRGLGFLFPEKPPVGYHFETLDYLAAGIGLEKLAELKPEVPESVKEFKDIEYKNINGKSLQLDLYKLKNLDEPAPLIVFIHGGGWKGGKRSDYLCYLVDYAVKGYVTATVSYRLVKDSIYPACVDDVTDAVDWLFRNGEKYGYDTTRIALVGGSAGAHLSMLAAYGWEDPRRKNDMSRTKHKIKAVVDIYGPVDLTVEYARTQRLLTRFIGHSYGEVPELYLEASPVHYLKPTSPPTLILHGTSDHLVPISQSDTLKSRLDALGVPCEYCRVPLWPHSMDMARRVNDYVRLKMDDFFEVHLK